MRYYEFIVEYKTDITKSNYGEKILDVLNVQDALDGLYQDSGRIPEPGTTKGWTPRQQDREVHFLRKLGDYKELILNVMGVAPWNRNGTERVVDQELYDEHKSEMIEALLKVFESFDPTRNKQYMRYIIKWFLYADWGQETEFPNIEDGRSTLNQAFDDFYRMKARIPEKYRDIAQYKDAGHFVDSVQDLREKYGKKEELPEGQIKIVYNDPKYAKAYWAVDEEGACYLGQGTQWCTASTRSANYFDQYDAKGPLLIFHMKKEIQYNLQDDYEDDGGHFHAEYAEDTSTFQATLKVDSRGDWLFGDGDIAAPDDTEIDFSDLYDYNSHFKAMYDSQEFQNAMTNVAKEWMKTTDHVAGAWGNARLD